MINRRSSSITLPNPEYSLIIRITKHLRKGSLLMIWRFIRSRKVPLLILIEGAYRAWEDDCQIVEGIGWAHWRHRNSDRMSLWKSKYGLALGTTFLLLPCVSFVAFMRTLAWSYSAQSLLLVSLLKCIDLIRNNKVWPMSQKAFVAAVDLNFRPFVTHTCWIHVYHTKALLARHLHKPHLPCTPKVSLMTHNLENTSIFSCQRKKQEISLTTITQP